MESLKVTVLKFVSYKIPDGKMVKVRVDVRNDLIQGITILGDFFLHPEDTLEGMEQGLIGTRAEESTIARVIQNILDRHKAVLIGATARDLAKAIMMAYKAD
ncbi:MAG: lipoate protein ligase C-terminal domain-containing protein [Promethearchaeota archaeon]